LCVIKSLSQIFWALKFTPALRHSLRVACCRNREHGWHWWKTGMGLDLHSCMFCNIYLYTESLPYRKDCLLFSSVVSLFSLCLLHHAIPSFYPNTRKSEPLLSDLYITTLHVLTFMIDPPFFRLIMNRLERDRPSIRLVDKFSFKEVIRSVSSPHVIMFLIMAFIQSTMTAGYSFFLPSIVKQLGFSRSLTQLLSTIECWPICSWVLL
jgi:hypothetical protein